MEKIMEVIYWIADNYELVIAFAMVLEVLVRLIPSAKNFSLVDKVKLILDKVIPNLIRTKIKQKSSEVKNGRGYQSQRLIKTEFVDAIVNGNTGKVYAKKLKKKKR